MRFAKNSVFTGLLFVTIAPLAAQEAPATAALVARFDAQLGRGFKPDEPGAAVIATRNGEVVYRRAFGKASLELDVDVRPEMAFCLASVTKPFTATAVMLLVEDGVLALGDSVTGKLEGVEIDPRITVEHLLSHTSGLPDFFGLAGHGSDDLHAAITPAALSRAGNGQPLQFGPGERHEYSNLNYALLARLVEVASGRQWEEFLGERVFEPAGMKHSRYGGDRRVIPGAVVNYQKQGDDWQRSEPLNYTRGFGLGGLFSTVDDLAAFDRALRGGKILQAATLTRMHQQARLADGSLGRYGLGWAVRERDDHRLIHHGGGINGWRSFLVRIPAAQVFVAVVSNRGEPRSPVGAAAMTIALALAGK